MTRIWIILFLILTTFIAPSALQAASPYAGQEARAIKALSAQEIRDLRAGAGAVGEQGDHRQDEKQRCEAAIFEQARGHTGLQEQRDEVDPEKEIAIEGRGGIPRETEQRAGLGNPLHQCLIFQEILHHFEEHGGVHYGEKEIQSVAWDGVSQTITRLESGEEIKSDKLLVALGRLANVIHPYPTRAEAIRQLGDAYNRTRLTPTAKRLFGTWFRLRR